MRVDWGALGRSMRLILFVPSILAVGLRVQKNDIEAQS